MKIPVQALVLKVQTSLFQGDLHKSNFQHLMGKIVHYLTFTSKSKPWISTFGPEESFLRKMQQQITLTIKTEFCDIKFIQIEVEKIVVCLSAK